MGRKPSADWLATATYCIGWAGHGSLAQDFRNLTKEAAVKQAEEWRIEMRRDGAASPIRRIRVRHRTTGAGRSDTPDLYAASYYDPDQGLTDAQAYAARVHDWHHTADIANRNIASKAPKWPTPGTTVRLFGYADWQGAWGAQPTVCPACQRVVNPQDFHI